jgi:uncharacterized cupin superfamily protein
MPKPSIIRAADRTADNALSFSHPMNPSSEIHGHPLSRPAGLSRIGVWVVRLAPGKESFVYHRHRREEEYIFVLAGRCVVEIDDEKHEVGAGDFVGFPEGTAHHVQNPFDEDVVYLSGGEQRDADVVDYPRLGKRMVRVGDRADVYTVAQAEGLPDSDRL